MRIKALNPMKKEEKPELTTGHPMNNNLKFHPQYNISTRAFPF